MEVVVVDGTEIAYRVVGDGPPVVVIHAAGLTDFFAPLLDSELARHARLISYHRIGYGRSGRASSTVEIADQAAHCAGLLQHLGHNTAHVVGHSSGRVIAIELARRSPENVAELRMPVLSVLGERSDDVSLVSREAHQLLLEHIPHAEGYVLPRATHLLQLQNPADLAEALTSFIGRNPIAT